MAYSYSKGEVEDHPKLAQQRTPDPQHCIHEPGTHKCDKAERSLKAPSGTTETSFPCRDLKVRKKLQKNIPMCIRTSFL